MELNKKHVVIPVFIPHKGCPFDCIYCDQKIISGQIDEMTVPKMRSIVEEHLKTIDIENSFVQIAFYGGSFTGIPVEDQINFLECAYEYIQQGKVESIRLSTRPDYINEEILTRLKKYNTKVIELGAQSLDDAVLKTSCRGHSREDVVKASSLIKEFGIELGIQTMIGLPGDTLEKDIDTALEVVKLAPSVVRIYPALVIRGTYMEKMYLGKQFQPLEVDEAVNICAVLMDIYEKNNINVIRVGLQPTESINDNMDVVAGPFHPAFRQLVVSRRILSILIEKLDKLDNLKDSSVTIYTDGSNISNVIGQRSFNINIIKNKYKIKELKVRDKKHFIGEHKINIFV